MLFELSPGANDKWSFQTLHSFNGNDGCCLVAGLVFDTTGNLYGTTRFGGPNECAGFGCGVVFKLAPGSRGNWAETVLHSFQNNHRDGYRSEAGLVLDTHGNLYGTTAEGGTATDCPNGCGTVFKVTHKRSEVAPPEHQFRHETER